MIYLSLARKKYSFFQSREKMVFTKTFFKIAEIYCLYTCLLPRHLTLPLSNFVIVNSRYRKNMCQDINTFYKYLLSASTLIFYKYYQP